MNQFSVIPGAKYGELLKFTKIILLNKNHDSDSRISMIPTEVPRVIDMIRNHLRAPWAVW